ncbi:hypothetical protein JQ599_27670 [Bradyrhizobium diazoefficiens]|nr:hypothetical protein [Bradyrhizobium diazoefficiens]MBR0703713.1 hypothetical protein [Bradyrhizobium diazoefficiens]MBR0772469.1 hypothetical protein [Bradyrhizobium diazoefficiens]
MIYQVWRFAIIAVGICGILWAADVVPYFEAESSIRQFSGVVERGERLTLTVSEISDVIDRSKRRRPTLYHEVAVLRTWMSEHKSNVGDETAELYRSASEAIELLPTDAFLWLVIAYIGPRYGLSSEEASACLSLSYDLAPNEGWLASIRNPTFVERASDLEPTLQEALFSEFVALVRSGLYDAAVLTLQNSSASIRSNLVGRLSELGQERKVDFARALRERNVVDLKIPGAELSQRRPWE